MNNALDAIFQRRAVKIFAPVGIPAEPRDKILDAARFAPSSFNIQPYRFYWLATPEIKTVAARLCFGQSPASTASALVVAVADIGSFKWATKSAALACQNLRIAAEALGFSTCPMEGFDGRRLAKLLGLSSRTHEIVMIIAIGKKSSSHEDRLQWRRPLEETVRVL